MRPFLCLLLLAAFCPSVAHALDCALLKSTDMPFAVTYELVTRAPGQDPTVETRQMQIFRKGRQTTIYTVSSAGIFLRTRGPNLLFPIEAYYSSHPRDPRKWTYSIDPTADYFSQRLPLKFSANMTARDGTLLISAEVTLAFGESGVQELGGCRFEAVRVTRIVDGLADRSPLATRQDGWVIPELQVELGSTFRTGDVEVTSTPTAISGDFKRVE